jgi:hypothetical protein
MVGRSDCHFGENRYNIAVVQGYEQTSNLLGMKTIVSILGWQFNHTR